MPRTGGEETRKRILETAEKLFSEKGFDRTSVESIAAAAKVNKALIYYHFKNKNDLIMHLFRGIIEELDKHLSNSGNESGIAGNEPKPSETQDKIRNEIEFLSGRKRIISLMLAEALRSDNRDDFLFLCADMVMEQERRQYGLEPRSTGKESQQFEVFEFFTGFAPVILFVALRDKWCAHFECDKEQLLDNFIEAFSRSHLASHLKKQS